MWQAPKAVPKKSKTFNSNLLYAELIASRIVTGKGEDEERRLYRDFIRIFSILEALFTDNKNIEL